MPHSDIWMPLSRQAALGQAPPAAGAADLPVGGVAVHAVHGNCDRLAAPQRVAPQSRVCLQAPQEHGRRRKQPQRLLEDGLHVRKRAPGDQHAIDAG